MWLPPDDESTAMEVAELLLDHGADPTVRDPQGMTAADRAERNAMFKVAAMLREREGETRPLTADLYSRHENCVLGSPLPCSRRRRFGAGATATDSDGAARSSSMARRRSCRRSRTARSGSARSSGSRPSSTPIGDGSRDRMFVDVTRQRQTETEGLKVPVIYESSPYYRRHLGQPAVPLERASRSSAPSRRRARRSRRSRSSRTATSVSNSLVDTWVPRGFAVVHSDAPGTGLSQGCVDRRRRSRSSSRRKR